MSISAILLNWNRAFNLKHIILPRLARHPLIDEIIISHGRAASMFDYCSPFCKVVHRNDIANNAKYGLSRRFIAMLTAKNDQILILDDDLVAFSKTIHRLDFFYQQDPAAIHGLFGRPVTAQFEYLAKTIFGRVPIVLTRCMMLNKQNAALFFENIHLVEGLLEQGWPYWNGEDIFMSLVMLKKTGKLHYAYRLPHINLVYSELNGISSQLKLSRTFTKESNGKLSHSKYRILFTKTCIERMNLQFIMNNWLNIAKSEVEL